MAPVSFVPASQARAQLPAPNRIIFETASQAITAGTPITLWTPPTGSRFWLYAIDLRLAASGTPILKDGTQEFYRLTAPSTALQFSSISFPGTAMWYGYRSLAVDNALKVDAVANGTLNAYWLIGYEDAS